MASSAVKALVSFLPKLSHAFPFRRVQAIFEFCPASMTGTSQMTSSRGYHIQGIAKTE
jgi:hypothetical protein